MAKSRLAVVLSMGFSRLAVMLSMVLSLLYMYISLSGKELSSSCAIDGF